MEVTRGALQAHRTMLRVGAVFRLITMVHIAVSVALLVVAGSLDGPVLLLAAAAFVEGAVVVRVFYSARRPPQLLAVWDALFCAGAFVVGAALSQRAGTPDPWKFLFPYVTMGLLLVGGAFRRALVAAAVGAPVVAAYLGSVLLMRDRYQDSVHIDLITFVGVAAAMWFLAREIRRWARALDTAAQEAVARQAELSAEQERNRYLRELHDHVLQTLETLGRGRFIEDERMRGHVARQAFRLRRLIEGAMPAGSGSGGGSGSDLAGALSEVVEEQIGAGLAVELQTRRLAGPVPVPVVEALAAATGEALTNVRKHSGVLRAVVRASSGPDGVTVSVLDRGRGFDAAAETDGLGIAGSIRGRLAQVGGAVRFDSAPDGGTCVVLTVPVGAMAEAEAEADAVAVAGVEAGAGVRENV